MREDAGSPVSTANSSGRRWVIPIGLGLVTIGAVVLRLLYGMSIMINSDEASIGLATVGTLKGHLSLVESNAHYQGALESWIALPFVIIAGPSQLALRLVGAVVGGIYVVTLYWAGRHLFSKDRVAPLILAAVGAVFPLLAITWGELTTGGYAELLVFEAALIALAGRASWGETPGSRRDWLWLGLVAGLGGWSEPLLVTFAAPLALATLIRHLFVRPTHWIQSLLLGLVGTVVGFAPWWGDQLTHNWWGVRDLPVQKALTLPHALSQALHCALPIVVGTASICRDNQVPLRLVELAAFLAVLALVIARATTIPDRIAKKMACVDLTDVVILSAIAVLVPALVTNYNTLASDPRYYLPIAVPMAVGATVILRHRMTRYAAIPLACAYLVAISLTLPAMYRNGWTLSTHTSTRGTLPYKQYPAVVNHLESIGAHDILMNYWFARDIQYTSGGNISSDSVLGWSSAFSWLQDSTINSPRPEWLLATNDLLNTDLVHYMQFKGITYQTVRFDNLILYWHISNRVTPTDLHIRWPT